MFFWSGKVHVRWLREVFDTLFSSLKVFSRWWQLKYFRYFHPYLGEMIQFDEHIFQTGWFNHHLYHFFLACRRWKNSCSWPSKRCSCDQRCCLPKVVWKGLVQEGSLNGTPFWEDQTWCKCMAIFRNIPYNSTLYGLVIIIYNDSWERLDRWQKSFVVNMRYIRWTFA